MASPYSCCHPFSDFGPTHTSQIVCVVRNVKSVAVSLYEHSTKIPAHNYNGSWDHFLGMFLKGEVCEGSWWDHTAGWWKAYKGPKGAQVSELSTQDQHLNGNRRGEARLVVIRGQHLNGNRDISVRRPGSLSSEGNT